MLKWHFNIEQDKFRAQLSPAWKKFYNLGDRSQSYKTVAEDSRLWGHN